MTEEKKTSIQRGAQAIYELICMALRDAGDLKLKTLACDAASGEAKIEMWLSGMLDLGLAQFVLPGLPHDDGDSWQFQPLLPWRGACDLLIYHANGTVSAVELKDGSQGLKAGQKGVGQVTCAAVHMNPAVHVRRVLAWTPMEVAEDNQTLAKACEACGIKPILPPSPDQRRRFREIVAKSVLVDVINGMKGAEYGPQNKG